MVTIEVGVTEFAKLNHEKLGMIKIVEVESLKENGSPSNTLKRRALAFRSTSSFIVIHHPDDTDPQNSTANGTLKRGRNKLTFDDDFTLREDSLANSAMLNKRSTNRSAKLSTSMFSVDNSPQL
ncbi:MAG: hypothetical protein V2I33_24840 [Kangiellaceae bacterium]|jgi:hypothetical protein|nr:hypothetical protein [Kangiellaceae bacterium]